MNSNWDSLEGVELHLLTTTIASSYIDWVYHGEPVNLHRGMESPDEWTSSSYLFNEGTSSNSFYEENEMLGKSHDLQDGIEHIEEMENDLENEMSFNSGVDLEEDRTNVIFE